MTLTRSIREALELLVPEGEPPPDPISGLEKLKAAISLRDSRFPWEITRCKSPACSGLIYWRPSEYGGRPNPVDVDGGTHFATCPSGDLFRNREPRDNGTLPLFGPDAGRVPRWDRTGAEPRLGDPGVVADGNVAGPRGVEP